MRATNETDNHLSVVIGAPVSSAFVSHSATVKWHLVGSQLPGVFSVIGSVCPIDPEAETPRSDPHEIFDGQKTRGIPP